LASSFASCSTGFTKFSAISEFEEPLLEVKNTRRNERNKIHGVNRLKCSFGIVKNVMVTNCEPIGTVHERVLNDSSPEDTPQNDGGADGKEING